MTDYTIYVFKTDNEHNAKWKPKLAKSLSEGVARFGWSWLETSDLKRVKAKVDREGIDALAREEREAWDNRFLLEVQKGDYLIYINLPSYGKCTIARVSGPYEWAFDWDDFNHRLAVDPSSLLEFDRNDEIVAPALSARLKLQGRYWRIYAKSEFEALLAALRKGGGGKARTADSSRQRLQSEISPLLEQIVERIHRTHPGKDLEPLVASMLAKIPGVTNVEQMRGRQDYGADVIFEYEFGPPGLGLQSAGSCAVQVKSYEGKMGYAKAIEDIRAAFKKNPDFTSGLIISTALSMSDQFVGALEALKKESGKPVSTLVGRELATFFLKYAAY